MSLEAVGPLLRIGSMDDSVAGPRNEIDGAFAYLVPRSKGEARSALEHILATEELNGESSWFDRIVNKADHLTARTPLAIDLVG